MFEFFKRKQKGQSAPVLSREEKDALKLSEYRAFDNAVGSWPTESTLRTRFRDAVFEGHTQVVKDTLMKGLKDPNEVRFVLLPPGGRISIHTSKTLDIAASRGWPDMVDVLLPHADKENLDQGLWVAEYKKDPQITRAIRAEMAKRNVRPEWKSS